MSRNRSIPVMPRAEFATASQYGDHMSTHEEPAEAMPHQADSHKLKCLFTKYRTAITIAVVIIIALVIYYYCDKNNLLSVSAMSSAVLGGKKEEETPKVADHSVPPKRKKATIKVKPLPVSSDSESSETTESSSSSDEEPAPVQKKKKVKIANTDIIRALDYNSDDSSNFYRPPQVKETPAAVDNVD